MASILEVWGSDFAKRPEKISAKTYVPEKRDANKEGRVFNTPAERTDATILKHRKTIDDLSQSLPIVKTDEEAAKNYHGAKFVPMTTDTREHFGSPVYAYAPPGFKDDSSKINSLLQRLEENRSTGVETNSTQDMMLYIFTGIFFLFTLDTFVNLGRKIRRK